MRELPTGWNFLGEFHGAAVFVCLDCNLNTVERKVVFQLDENEIISFRLYIGRRKISDSLFGEGKIITTRDEARAALVAAANLKLCPGFRRPENSDKQAYGFDFTLREAMRNYSELCVIGEAPQAPAIGVLFGKKSSNQASEQPTCVSRNLFIVGWCVLIVA